VLKIAGERTVLSPPKPVSFPEKSDQPDQERVHYFINEKKEVHLPVLIPRGAGGIHKKKIASHLKEKKDQEHQDGDPCIKIDTGIEGKHYEEHGKQEAVGPGNDPYGHEKGENPKKKKRIVKSGVFDFIVPAEIFVKFDKIPEEKAD
jgi:hypothetical protein